MTQPNRNPRGPNGGEPAAESPRKTVQLAVLIIAVVAVGSFLLFRSGNNDHDAPAPGDAPPPATGSAAAGGESTPAAGGEWTPPRPPPVAVSEPPPSTGVAAVPAVIPVAATATLAPEELRQQVASLAELDFAQGDLNPTQLAAYTQALTNLFAQGTAAFASAASALSPAQIEQLAHNMGALAPDQFRPFALAAANAALTAAGQSQEKQDVGALFRVLQDFGGPEAVGQLESLSGDWRYYSTIALANLPDNAGVDSLIRMATDPNNRSTRSAALPALAQSASSSPEAMAILVDLAKQNTITFADWIRISSVLGGKKLYIGPMPTEQAPNANGQSWSLEYSKEQFHSVVDPTLSPEQINQSRTILNELGQATEDPTIKQLLQQSNDTLATLGTAPAPEN